MMRRGALLVGVAAFAVPGLLLLGAQAQEPSASASAQPEVDEAMLRSLETKPPPEVKSEKPKPEEWNGAERVALFGKMPGTCKAYLLREWLQIRCDNNGAAFAVLSGSTEDVTTKLVRSAFTAATETEGATNVTGSITIQLPIRRGDRRVMQVSTTDFNDYSGGMWGRPLMTISEQWLDDQPGPWVSVGPGR
jgi:hypothetical protein